MFIMMNESFIDWLRDELRNRDLSQAELARRSGLSPSNISMTINGQKEVGLETIQGLSKAFGYPVEYIMTKAGLSPRIPDPRQAAVEILGYKLNELDDAELDQVIQFIEFIQSRKDPQSRTNHTTRRREGETPPASVKE